MFIYKPGSLNNKPIFFTRRSKNGLKKRKSPSIAMANGIEKKIQQFVLRPITDDDNS